MPDGCKPILSPFTGHKKRKAWNKTREKYMPVKRRQNLLEADRGLYDKEEWFFKGTCYNGNGKDNNDESYNENNEQQQLPEGFANSCYEIV